MVRSPCIDRMKKGAWSEEEDNKLRAYILRYGHWNWRLLPHFAGLDRCGKSCRLRWMNYLKPGIKRGNLSKQEQDLIIKLHAQLGNKWSTIAKELPGRTDNEIKNFWHTHIEKHRKQQRDPAAKKVKKSDSCGKDMHQVLDEEKASDVPHGRSSTDTRATDCGQGQEKTSDEIPILESFDSNTNTQSELQQMDSSWPDIFQASDTTSDSQNDFAAPMFDQDFFYPEFEYYNELSSPIDSFYLSSAELNWINADENNYSSLVSSNQNNAPTVPESFCIVESHFA